MQPVDLKDHGRAIYVSYFKFLHNDLLRMTYSFNLMVQINANLHTFAKKLILQLKFF